MAGKKIGIWMAVLAVIVVSIGCSGGAAQTEVSVEMRPLVGFREFVRVSAADGRLTGSWDEGGRLDVIDLKDQFYRFEELSVTVPEEFSQTVWMLDDGETVLGSQELKSGENILPADGNVRYLVFPMEAAGRDKLQYHGRLQQEEAEARARETLSNAVLNGKRLSVLGDSLSSAVDYCQDGSYGQYPLADAEISDIWWYQIAKDFGMEICRINACAGSGVTDRMGRPETAAGPGGRGSQLSANGLDPEVIIVWIGANDALQGVSLEEVRDAYRMMLEDITAAYPEAELYLCTYYTISSEPLRQLNQMIREMAGEYGTQLLDMENCGVTTVSGALVDGSHPGREGWRIITEYMKEALKEQ